MHSIFSKGDWLLDATLILASHLVTCYWSKKTGIWSTSHLHGPSSKKQHLLNKWLLNAIFEESRQRKGEGEIVYTIAGITIMNWLWWMLICKTEEWVCKRVVCTMWGVGRRREESCTWASLYWRLPSDVIGISKISLRIWIPGLFGGVPLGSLLHSDPVPCQALEEWEENTQGTYRHSVSTGSVTAHPGETKSMQLFRIFFPRAKVAILGEK